MKTKTFNAVWAVAVAAIVFCLAAEARSAAPLTLSSFYGPEPGKPGDCEGSKQCKNPSGGAICLGLDCGNAGCIPTGCQNSASVPICVGTQHSCPTSTYSPTECGVPLLGICIPVMLGVCVCTTIGISSSGECPPITQECP